MYGTRLAALRFRTACEGGLWNERDGPGDARLRRMADVSKWTEPVAAASCGEGGSAATNLSGICGDSSIATTGNSKRGSKSICRPGWFILRSPTN